MQFSNYWDWSSMVIANTLDHTVIVFPGLVLAVAIHQYCLLYLVAVVQVTPHANNHGCAGC